MLRAIESLSSTCNSRSRSGITLPLRKGRPRSGGRWGEIDRALDLLEERAKLPNRPR